MKNHGSLYVKGERRPNQGGSRPGAGRPTKEEAAAKEEMIRVALDTLKLSMFKAVSTLVRLLDSDAENISLRAAESIISFTQKAIEHEELEKRIKALEERLIQQGGNYR
jgi:hypothetical protein